MGLDPDKKKEAHITDYDPNRLIIIFFCHPNRLIHSKPICLLTQITFQIGLQMGRIYMGQYDILSI